jgi:hypothetical protein
MQFKVPQFLEIEDKIFGPFTFKEFIYLAGGGGLCFILYKLLGLIWGSIPILLVAGFSVALTFYRPNDKPFINMVEASFSYLFKDKLYIWKRRTARDPFGSYQKETVRETASEEKRQEMLENISKLGGNKLRDLAWSLDVLDADKHQSAN